MTSFLIAKGNAAGWTLLAVSVAVFVWSFVGFRGVRPLLLTLLTALVVLTMLEHIASAFTWTRPGESLVRTVAGSQGPSLSEVFRGSWGTNTGVRRWRVWPRDDTDVLRLHSSVAHVTGPLGQAWGRSSERIEVSPGALGVQTITFPSDGDPYVFRSARFADPIAGRTFRAEVGLRFIEPPVENRSTRGVWLREAEGRRRWHATFVESLSDEWRTYVVTWTVPEDSTSSAVHYVLNDFDGATLEVRDGRLDERTPEGWRPIPETAPHGVRIDLEVVGANGETAVAEGGVLIPEADGSDYDVVVSVAGLEPPLDVTARLRLEPDVVIRTAGTELQPARKLSLPATRRQAIFMGHPNLLGHAVAMLWIAWLSWPGARRRPRDLVPGSLAVIGIALSGSHTALISFVISTGWSVLFNVRRSLFPGSLILLSFIGLVAIVIAWTAGPMFANTGIRLEAWHAAWADLRAAPWSGARGLRVSDVGVAHAHNLWLQWASLYGVPGLVAAGWLTGGFLVVALRGVARAAMPVVVAFLILQALDFTLSSTAVLAPVVVVLAATDLRPSERRALA